MREVPGDEMRGIASERSKKNRPVLLGQINLGRAGALRRRFLNDLYGLHQLLEPAPLIALVEVAPCLFQRVGRCKQLGTSNTPETLQPRFLTIGRAEEDVGVEEEMVHLAERR